jgi:predicted nuclease of predicted toxin-antitoxin system
VRVLLNECVDWRLACDIVGHNVKTTRQMGWTTKKNGELLALASGDFDVFITVDRNLAFQQNLTGKPIAVVILLAKTNRLVDLRSLVPELLETLDSVQVGTVNFVGRK